MRGLSLVCGWLRLFVVAVCRARLGAWPPRGAPGLAVRLFPTLGSREDKGSFAGAYWLKHRSSNSRRKFGFEVVARLSEQNSTNTVPDFIRCAIPPQAYNLLGVIAERQVIWRSTGPEGTAQQWTR